MPVDSYCENLLDPEQRREALNTIDVLIRELYAPVTEYTEEEFRQGFALMFLVKKYCMTEKCLSGLQMSEDFRTYWDKTLGILNNELARCPSRHDAGQDEKAAAAAKELLSAGRKPAAGNQAGMSASPEKAEPASVSFDNALTVVGNMLQLLSSVIVRQKELAEEAKKKPVAQVFGIRMPEIALGGKPGTVSFARSSVSPEDVPAYLDSVWKLTDKYTAAKKRHGQAEDILRYIEFKYLSTCLELTRERMQEWEAI